MMTLCHLGKYEHINDTKEAANMPTQRFMKLKEEKKHAILGAAVHEFSRVPYSCASINQIIKEADISRGSFYTYFEDKDDLMQYILRGFRDKCQQKIFGALEETEGNPFEAARRLLIEVMEQGGKGLGYQMYRNMLSDLSMVNQNHLLGIKGFMFQDEVYKAFVARIYKHMDKERFPIREQDTAYLVELLMLVSMKAISHFYKDMADKAKLLEVAQREIQFLEKGFCP